MCVRRLKDCVIIAYACCGKQMDIDLLCACLYSYSEAASGLQHVVQEMEEGLVSVCVCVCMSVYLNCKCFFAHTHTHTHTQGLPAQLPSLPHLSLLLAKSWLCGGEEEKASQLLHKLSDLVQLKEKSVEEAAMLSLILWLQAAAALSSESEEVVSELLTR